MRGDDRPDGEGPEDKEEARADHEQVGEDEQESSGAKAASERSEASREGSEDLSSPESGSREGEQVELEVAGAPSPPPGGTGAIFEFADPVPGQAEGADASELEKEPVEGGGDAGRRNEGEEGSDEGRDPLEEGLARARKLAREGQREAAIDAYRSLAKAYPASVKARNNLGVLFDETGDHPMALEQFQAARDLEPENADVLSNLGAALGALGRFDEAERELRRALRLAPERVDVRANLGILYFRRGLYAEAEAELRWVCQRDADHGAAHFYRGEALNRLGKVDEALEMLERASHLQPGNAKAYHVMGILYDKKHLPREAAAMYRKARELSDQ